MIVRKIRGAFGEFLCLAYYFSNPNGAQTLKNIFLSFLNMCVQVLCRGIRNDLKTLCNYRFQTMKLEICSLSLVVISSLK